MDKNKIIEAAAKLVAKGAYDKAIKEYQKVLDGDARDVRVLQKMGELYQKKNDNAQAAFYFTKVAESYSQDGFFLKAVALYKQVLKLNPDLVDVNLKLAELHQQLGLMSEALAYFQLVANHHDQQGDAKASLDTLKKMVDLDPDNVASRIKLAELYSRESMSGEALAEFKRAAEYLKRNNRGEDYLRVAERISSLEPDNLALARELAQTFLQKGDQKRALAKLQVCFKADPRDLETLILLAQAFQGLGQTSKTVSVYKELAKVYQEKGQSSEEQKIWAKIRELDPQDADAAARSGGGPRSPAPSPAQARMPAPSALFRTPAPAPAHARAPAPSPTRAPARAETPMPAPRAPAEAPAPRPQVVAPAARQPLATAPAPATVPAGQQAGGGGAPARPAAASGGGRDQLAKLLTETDVYVKYGLHDKALEHLRKVFAIDPENLDAHEKAYHIYLGSNNQAQAQDQLLNVLRLCTRRREVQRAQPYLATILQQNPGHPEVPAFLAVLRTDQVAPAPAARGGDEEAILVDSSEEEIIVADAPEDALAGSTDDMAIHAAAADEGEQEVVEEEGLLEHDVTGPHAIAGVLDESGATLDDADALEEDAEPEPVTSSIDLVALRGQIVAATAPEHEPATLDDGARAELLSIEDEDDEEPKTLLAPSLAAQEALITEPNYKRVGSARRPEMGHPAPGAKPELTQPAVRVPRPEPKTLTNRVSAAEVAAAAREPTGRPGAASDGPTRIETFPMRPPGRAPLREEAKAGSPAPDPARVPPARVAPAHLEPEAPENATLDEPASEECDEAAFFLDQGLLDEAREVLETVLVAYPGHARANELMARLEAASPAEAAALSGVATTEHSLPVRQPPSNEDTGPKDAFDLAAELAGELGEGGSAPAEPGGSDDFQYSVDEVFSEFKKGLEKVVKPEDVETHYDLGIAYKEMGLLDDAIGEMTTAQKGCQGKKKEVDCLLMAGILQGMKGDHAAAVESFREGLTSEHSQPPGESFKALAFELGTSYEALGKPGKALFWFQKIARADPGYREVSDLASRLQASARPEDDPLPERKNGLANGANGVHGKGQAGGKSPGGAGTPPGGAASSRATDSVKTRKVGYV